MVDFQVTRKDLVEFHKRHFGCSPGVEPLASTAMAIKADAVHVPDTQAEFYPDGVRRTLTDEQIAFFRASEARRSQQSKEKRSLAPKLASEEETLPGTPISNDRQQYDRIFGKFADFIKQLEDANNTAFVDACRTSKVKAYYPAAPLY